MEEWKEYKLGDIANIQTGPFGSQLHNEDYVDIGTPIVTVEHLGKRKFTKQNLPMVSDSDKNRLSKYILKEGDIVFSRVGSVDRCSFVSKDEEGWLFSGRCLRVRCSEISNPLFVYYYFCTSYIRQYVKNIAVGATMPSINTGLLSQLPIILPSLSTQQIIANILSSLDDKIEVNRRINEQLEELAGALFKSWFVDFEPFKDGEFVDSELGMIPKGWKVGILSDIGEVVGGATPSKSKSEYYTDNGISWITPKDLSINKDKFISKGEIDITELGYSKCSAKMMPRGSVLFSSRAPIGYIAIAKNELCTNQGFKSVVPQLAGTAFIYYYLKNNVSNIESMASGSTFKEASGALMKSLNVIVPESNILQDFEEKVCSIFDKQESLEQEIHHLTTLRDTLLPKLMSGEIDVNEVEI